MINYKPDFNKQFISLKFYLLGKRYFQALKALDFAKSYHTGKRLDNAPEFQHQVQIALYLITLKDIANEELVLTVALLHDVMEDYDISREEMESRFGKVTADKVWLLTKFYKGEKKDLKKYFAAIALDPEASLAKGADRINNIQSMQGAFNFEKQKSYTAEVLERFLPMLKEAKYHFPEQSAAYFNIIHMLKSQVELLNALHAAVVDELMLPVKGLPE